MGIQRMNPEQRAKWDAAYQPKNNAFMKAKLKGKELISWKYQRYIKDYCDARSVDDSVGEPENAFSPIISRNTVFIYSSDQGFYLGEHGWFDKRFMYDESYRTPLLVDWPGGLKLAVLTTISFQTLILHRPFSIWPVHLPKDMQGASLVPLLKGKPKTGENIITITTTNIQVGIWSTVTKAYTTAAIS